MIMLHRKYFFDFLNKKFYFSIIYRIHFIYGESDKFYPAIVSKLGPDD